MNEEEINEEMLEEVFEDRRTMSESLPAIVKEFQKSATEVSHYNEVPAAISFFTILGQVSKDFVQIPKGRNVSDSRIHFCWIQTSGTGKSTLYNFVGPIAKSVFKKINETQAHPRAVRNDIAIPKIFDTFSLVDYTDASLIGYYKKVFDEEGNDDWERIAGALEGSGLAHWDEFEYSGVFKATQHKESSIVYLNTLMNTLAGESWIITKKLKEGDVMECFCERSVMAMTYPPKNLEDVMAEKGVLQRMLVFVWAVEDKVQDTMRREQIALAGKYVEVNQPIERFANAIFNIYLTLKERYEEVGRNPLDTMTYADGFNDSLLLEYENMHEFIQSKRKEVKEIAGNFTTRLMETLMKLSVLCSIAQSPSIKDKSKRFIVTGNNVRQASAIIRQCYKSLVDWLTDSLRVRRKTLEEKSMIPSFIKVFLEMEKDEEGFVSKKLYLDRVQKETKKSQPSIYNYYKTISHKFEEDKVGRSVFVKYKGDEKE
tara:strand:+ start:4771 stop:6225 length:1455 start_codon:yes stop_codon:yes gene_type:complete